MTTCCSSLTCQYVQPPEDVSVFCRRVLTVSVRLYFQDEEMPLVYIGVFIEHATPFMEEFLDRLTTLNYPPARIRLFIHNNVGLIQNLHWFASVKLCGHLLKPLYRSSTMSATSRCSGSVTELCSLMPSWLDPRRTCWRARPETWQCKWQHSSVTLTHSLWAHSQSKLDDVCVYSEACKKDPRCDYYFSIDSDVALTNPDTLRILMEENKYVIS